MSAQISYRNIPFDTLNDSSTWDFHPFLDDVIPDFLVASIADIGILHPPVIIETGAETYDVICGRKRIQCGYRLGQSSILFRVLPPDTPKRTILRVLLEDQISGRPLSIIEMAYYSQLCMNHLDEDEALAILPREPRLKIQRKHLLSLLEFDHATQRSIHFGHLAEKILYDLLKLNREDRTRLAGLIEQLQLGEGKQKRLVTLCREISVRENLPISILLDQPEIKTVIAHHEMNAPQKASRLLTLLQKRCYPQSTAARESFQTQLDALDLPRGWDICPSPFFEKDEVTLSLHFPDFEACKRILPSLKDFLDRIGDKSPH
jgi:ParB family transcriptional regulator, chromosome partitioning protein